MPKTDTLIRTKLHLPYIRPGLVARPRLQEQITQGLCGPLTLITAPAGFGKTTLAAAGAARSGLPVAWLSLDKEDNQPGRFLNYLVAALQGADQRIGGEAAQLLASMPQATPEAMLTSLINDVDAAGVELVLVVDDYQFITSAAVNAAMAFLLDHCPRTLHLLVATRSDPPLPLARLRARGQLVELRAADLRFTPAEAGQFLNDVMGLHLDAAAVTALDERTEGWIAGLQMASIALQAYLSVRDRQDALGFIQGFSGTNRFILDYLLEEVLAHQPPETQRFLLCTSVLEHLTAPLCDALLAGGEDPAPGVDGSPACRQLEYLQHENLFLVSLDAGAACADGAGWFRYHHLFADLLKARLQQTQPELVAQLHIRASAWLEQHGFIPEAIQHLFAAQQVDRAAGLIERHGPARWKESDLSVIYLADSLPREVILSRPKIGLYQAWLMINQGQIEKALPLLHDLAQQPASADSEIGQPWIGTVAQLALAFLIPPGSAPGPDPLPDPQLLDEIPAAETVMRDAADILYGMALTRRGDIDRAAEFALNCIQRQKTTHGLPHEMPAIPTLVPFLATVYLFQGRLHASAALCREYLGPIKEKGILISTAGNMDVILGYSRYEWNCLEASEQHLRDGLQANQPWGNIMTDAFGLLALARVLQARGDYAGAMQVVEKFEGRLQGKSRPIEFSEEYRTLRVRMQLASGDLQAAADWAEQVPLSEDYQQHPDFYRLTLARIRLAQGRWSEVAELLRGEPPWRGAGNRLVRQVETGLLLAAAAAAQRRLPEALDMLDACLELAEPEGYIQVFLDVGEPVRELLGAYLRQAASAHKRHAQKVFEAFSPSGGCAPNPQAGLVEPLTPRELEVLQLMALGRTNQEIAEQLVVAPGTIKAHAASIYRKLDSANRTEAVTRARQLSLLP